MTPDPLAPQPMTRKEVRDLVERVRAKESPLTRGARIATSQRWAKWRRERAR